MLKETFIVIHYNFGDNINVLNEILMGDESQN